MSTFAISIELGDMLEGNNAPLNAGTFPTLAYAVQAITEAAHKRWQDFASGAPLPTGKVIENRTGTYLRSILTRQLGDFSAEVYSDLPYAQAIEEGTPARDLKHILNSSLKVRLGKKGRYLIIPFRWNKPGSVLGHEMPVDVSNWWGGDERRASHITGTFRRTSGTGALDIKTRQPLTVPGRTYSWGSRITKLDLQDMGFDPGDRVAKRLRGMVNFRKPGGTGGGAHSQFITFRVMSQNSKGWIAPAREGMWPARTASEQITPVAEEAFRRAMQEDVARLLGGTVTA